MTMEPIRHLMLVALFLSCALAAPQFAYTTTSFSHPFVPLPFARAPYHNDFYDNQIDQATQDAPSRLPPSPWLFLPATLPRAIYSEPAHVLSGYSYQTLDPAGAKSQVLFVSGPNSQQLFRQNADLLQIVLPSLFTADGDDVISRTTPDSPAGLAQVSDEGDSSTSAESRTGEEGRKSDEEEAKPTETSDVPEKSEESSKEDTDKSSEETTGSPTEKEDEVKSDVSTSEASNSPKAVPLESDTVESASTEAPTTSASVSDDKKSDETKSEEKSSEVKPSDEDQTIEPVVATTTVVPAE